ncbi:ABC transporter substrate-binding protein [Halostella sp. PRR32]|uniref:ABC transporter substrate-binding protein n=1 Tax=Halostella sp. PRR32 TaxID=3098147 RepID=UPI002B1E68BF|nr:ABC transporter substrate-binding protein [Halostella sp. PRR32]
MAEKRNTECGSSPRRRDVLKATAAAGTTGLVGVTGCLTNEGSDGDTVTVGWLYPHTGPYSGLAEYQEQGAKLAIEQLNDSDDIDIEIEGLHEDTQADPQTARQIARRYVENENVDVVCGTISSAAGSAVQSYTEQRNVPFFPDIAADEITMDSCTRNTFRYETRASQTATAAASWAVENFGTDIWVHNADYLWGNSVAEAWKSQAKSANGNVNIEGETTSELGATDFSTYISQMSDSDADWVVTGLNGGDAVQFLKQANSHGLKDEMTIVSPVNSFQFIRRAAPEASVGTYSAVRYFEGYDSPENKEFVDLYTDRWDQPPDNFAHVSWTHMFMYAHAVDSADSADPDDVIDELPSIDFTSPMGPTQFRDCDHQAVRPYNVGEIVEPDQHDWPSIDVMRTVSAEDTMLPCEETGCNF